MKKQCEVTGSRKSQVSYEVGMRYATYRGSQDFISSYRLLINWRKILRKQSRVHNGSKVDSLVFETELPLSHIEPQTNCESVPPESLEDIIAQSSGLLLLVSKDKILAFTG
jgi:hypothetical protein